MRKETITRPILPVCLLVAGRPCLVAGGGEIATRKVGHLLDAGAAVTVVSPKISAPLRTLAASGKIVVLSRAFSSSDVKGKHLAIATTDSRAVNSRVLAACRKHRVLCSAADSNWPNGDFMMPAICRNKDVVVTVSTGGRSCRQARMIKDKIAGLIASLTVDTAGDK